MGLEKRLCYVLSSSPSPRARGFSRVFSAPEKRAFRARNLFFLYLFHGKCLAQQKMCSIDIFLCNHKHIQSFVNSVLIIAKTLSLSPSLARAFILEASAKEREKERKRKRDTKILIFFSCEEKKAFTKKRRKGKRRKETEKTLTQKTTQNHLRSSSFSFSFDILTKKSIIIEKTTEKRSIKKGSER